MQPAVSHGTWPTPLFVGLDVHKDSIALAHVQGQSTDPPVFVGAIGTRQADIDQMVRRLESKAPMQADVRPPM